jgi:hypothetical protein
MAIATQYKAHSLIRHCQRGWNFFRAERNEYLDILPASQRVDENKWYLGTADAVTQNIDIVDSYGVDYVLILAGDHIYKMDYEVMIQHHVDSGRGRDRGLPDRARGWRPRPSASWRWTPTTASPSFWKSPPIRPARPTIPRGARLDGDLRLQAGRSCATCCSATPRTRIQATISART